jgi:NAD(P)-dependent dehydrogenase (short-subunit alcohol dehydrogenase family)
MRFQDKVAVITASASGIGKAIAKIMAGEGAQLVAVDISAPDLATVAEELEAAGGNVTTMQVDVLDAQQVEGMVDSIVNKFGRIDILVNAVGGSNVLVDPEGAKSALMTNNAADVEDITPEEWDKSIQFNLRGTFLCTKAVVPHMKKQGSGKIVNFSSISGHAVGDTNSAYVAAKAGIMAFTKKISSEVGPYGINCNAIAPGVTLTPRAQQSWAQKSEEEKRFFTDRIPMRRLGRPEDQANTVAFLASADADYVTGVTIDVSGGR